jgi:predicted dehydrogenase
VSDTSPLRISFIGAGGICEQRHLPNLQQLPGVELVAVCNRSLESSQRSREKWKFERAESDWRKVIDDDAVDAIFIGTWPYLHRELSLAALGAGKHVFCQARLCMDWQEAKLMAAAAQASPQLVSMVCPSPFRVRWERSVRQVLASPEFGELQAVAVSSLSAANINPSQATWRERVEYSGLNILQVGIYAETLHAWCGEYETLAGTTSIPLQRKGDYEVRVPQVVTLSGQLKNGAAGGEFHSGLSAVEQGTITLFGSRGTCLVDLLAGRVSLRRQDATESQTIDEAGDPWLVEAELLTAVRAARRGEAWQVRPNFVEASRYMLKMQALHDSAHTNSTIRLDQYEA